MASGRPPTFCLEVVFISPGDSMFIARLVAKLGNAALDQQVRQRVTSPGWVSAMFAGCLKIQVLVNNFLPKRYNKDEYVNEDHATSKWVRNSLRYPKETSYFLVVEA